MRKINNFLAQPVLLVLSFYLVLINGEHIGGFYIGYIIIGISFPFAWIGVGGTILLALRNAIKNERAKNVASVLGALMLLSSLLIFFLPNRYNWGTFYDPVSLISILFFTVIWLAFVINAVVKMIEK